MTRLKKKRIYVFDRSKKWQNVSVFHASWQAPGNAKRIGEQKQDQKVRKQVQTKTLQLVDGQKPKNHHFHQRPDHLAQDSANEHALHLQTGVTMELDFKKVATNAQAVFIDRSRKVFFFLNSFKDQISEGSFGTGHKNLVHQPHHHLARSAL